MVVKGVLKIVMTAASKYMNAIKVAKTREAVEKQYTKILSDRLGSKYGTGLALYKDYAGRHCLIPILQDTGTKQANEIVEVYLQWAEHIGMIEKRCINNKSKSCGYGGRWWFNFSIIDDVIYKSSDYWTKGANYSGSYMDAGLYWAPRWNNFNICYDQVGQIGKDFNIHNVNLSFIDFLIGGNFRDTMLMMNQKVNNDEMLQLTGEILKPKWLPFKNTFKEVKQFHIGIKESGNTDVSDLKITDSDSINADEDFLTDSEDGYEYITMGSGANLSEGVIIGSMVIFLVGILIFINYY